MSVISWVIVGIAAAWLATNVTSARHGVIGNLALGTIGALIVGGITSNRVGGDAGLVASIIVSAIAAAVLVIVRNTMGSRAS